ncbi:MAG: hypothetical protein V7L05_15905 [Nostoc sp.]|uniref:hypothetical protein n=1 Tax=Nostoc sp. TaxID=1180 RepID=UPI002FFB6779
MIFSVGAIHELPQSVCYRRFNGWGVDAITNRIESAWCMGDIRFAVSLYSDVASQRFGSITSYPASSATFAYSRR